MNSPLTALFLVLALNGSLHADPQLTSWYTLDSGKYARLFTSTANESTGTSATTWSRESGTENGTNTYTLTNGFTVQ